MSTHADRNCREFQLIAEIRGTVPVTDLSFLSPINGHC